jgi:hypothetical protein
MNVLSSNLERLRHKADECLRLAAIVESEESRTAYLRLARSYETLAESISGHSGLAASQDGDGKISPATRSRSLSEASS